MIDVRVLCRQHILGAHGELHKFRHNFIKGHSIAGRKGQIEPHSMESRHDELAVEMMRRGYNHNSPYEQPDLLAYDLTDHGVDRDKSLTDLLARCPKCRLRYHKIRRKIPV